MNAPQQQFVHELARLGLEPRVVGPLVEYVITPVDGVHAGSSVVTAVATEDLTRWPVVPPHWVHLPAGLTFPRTNARRSSKAGWLMHSRNIAAWGTDKDATRAWAAHVRGVLGEATA